MVRPRQKAIVVAILVLLAALLGASAYHLLEPRAVPGVARASDQGGDSSDPSDGIGEETRSDASITVMDRLRRHEVNFVSLLDEIRGRCLPEWDRPECNEMTRSFLQEHFRHDNDGVELLQVYDQYIRYEDYVAEQRLLQNLPLDDVYPSLQQARVQFIDADTRRWLFGVEDARMAYEMALRDFMAEQAPKLPPAERLQQLGTLRKETLGAFYDLFVTREDPLLFLETQLALLQLSELTTPAEQALQGEIRAKMDTLLRTRQENERVGDPAETFRQ